MPFFTGYGVEIGLLIDIAESAGLSAIGQVDLERRIHRNQPLANLSQMSFTSCRPRSASSRSGTGSSC